MAERAERAESIGARLDLSSSDGGTCVRAVRRPRISALSI
jgi:hypothetical protein